MAKRVSKNPKSVRWWDAAEGAVHNRVVDTFQTIDNQQTKRRTEYSRFLSMYEARDITSMDGTEWATSTGAIDREETKENLVSSIVDSATAKISTSRPRPRFLTANSYKLKKKAIRKGLFVEGVYHDQNAYGIARQVFRDAGIFGTGLIHVFGDPIRGKICMERVLVDEIGVDYIDGKYAAPRSMFRHKVMSRSVVAEMFPKAPTMQLNSASLVRRQTGRAGDSIDDPISVLMAWHLPSGPDASDGRYVAVCSTCTLEDKPWTRERFPFGTWRWKQRSLGWPGKGLAEDILSHQHNLDELNETISEVLNLMSVRVGIKTGSKINMADLDNAPFASYEYDGDPPIFHNDPGPSPEVLGERDRIAQSAFHQTGISQLSATSKQPKGVTAGVALQELKDTESERFQDVGQTWDWLLGVEVPEIILDEAADLAEVCPDLAVMVPTGGETFDMVKWGEFKADKRTDYLIQPWPAAYLPREPGGRIEKINYLMSMFPQAAPLFSTLIDHPDVDAAMRLVSAPVDAIMSDVEKLEEGEFLAPEPFLDLQTAKMIVLSNYQSMRNQNAPETVLEAHRQYLISLQGMIEQQQAVMAQQQGMAAGGPVAPGPEVPAGPMP